MSVNLLIIYWVQYIVTTLFQRDYHYLQRTLPAGGGNFPGRSCSIVPPVPTPLLLPIVAEIGNFLGVMCKLEPGRIHPRIRNQEGSNHHCAGQVLVLEQLMTRWSQLTGRFRKAIFVQWHSVLLCMNRYCCHDATGLFATALNFIHHLSDNGRWSHFETKQLLEHQPKTSVFLAHVYNPACTIFDCSCFNVMYIDDWDGVLKKSKSRQKKNEDWDFSIQFYHNIVVAYVLSQLLDHMQFPGFPFRMLAHNFEDM